MARRTLFVLAASFLAALALPAAAIAGGGCHDGATTGTGDTVEMKDACFRPSTLHHGRELRRDTSRRRGQENQ